MAQPVPTSSGGWDTAVGIKLGKLSAHLKSEPGLQSLAFSHAETSLLTGGHSIDGTFGAWRFSGSSDSGKIGLIGKIAKGDYTITDGSGNKTTNSLKDVEIVFEIDLTKQASTGSVVHVVLAPDSSSATDVIIPKGSNLGVKEKITVQGLFTNWATKKMPALAKPLASLDLTAQIAAKNKNFDWMAHSDYAFSVVRPTLDASASPEDQQKALDEDSVLCLVTMIGKARATPTTVNLDAALVPEGDDVGMILNTPVFLENLLLPEIHHGFAGAKPTDFELISNGNALQNKNDVTTKDMTLKDGTVVSPTIKASGYQVSVSGEHLNFDIKQFHFQIGALYANVDAHYQASNKMEYNPKLKFPVIRRQNGGGGGYTVTANNVVDWISITTAVLAAVGTLMSSVSAVLRWVGPVSTATTATDSASIAESALSPAQAYLNDATELSDTMSEMSTASKSVAAEGFFSKNAVAIAAICGACALPGTIVALVNHFATAKAPPTDALDNVMTDVTSHVDFPGLTGTFAVDTAAFNNGYQLGGTYK